MTTLLASKKSRSASTADLWSDPLCDASMSGCLVLRFIRRLTCVVKFSSFGDVKNKYKILDIWSLSVF